VVEVKFWKMHGLGNDYIVVDNRGGEIKEGEASDLARRLCERRFSVGADGMLLVCNSRVADVKMRVFNADGSGAEMCGNGIRCFAKYCYENNIAKVRKMRIETMAGVKTVWLTVDRGEVEKVKVDMGTPILERAKIPMLGEGICVDKDLEVDGEKFRVTCLSVGNPHCVIFVDDVKNFPVQKIGPRIENHKLFPRRVNVEFVEVLNNKELKIRVWERGCGETLACGTGACASAVAGNLLKKTAKKLTAHLLGGDLEIEFLDNKLSMRGGAEKVFEGRLF
jgi:diaminopimelate epimerase